MALSDRYLGSPDYNTPTDAEHDIDDLYNKMNDIESELQLIRQKEYTVTVNYPEVSTSSDAQIASITDAVGDIKTSNDNIYTWVVVVAFVIVILESKKMFRGAIKKYLE